MRFNGLHFQKVIMKKGSTGHFHLHNHCSLRFSAPFSVNTLTSPSEITFPLILIFHVNIN